MSRTFVYRLGYVNYIHHQGQYYKDKLHSPRRMYLLERLRAKKHQEAAYNEKDQLKRMWRFFLATNARERAARWKELSS